MTSRAWTPSVTAMDTRVFPPAVRTTEARFYTGRILPLEEADRVYFSQRYELDLAIGLRFISRSDDGRYVLPINGPAGEQRGVILRKPWDGSPLVCSDTSAPKADTYRYEAGPLQSFYQVPPWLCTSGVLVLVEDQLSAIKLHAFGYDSVALLGTPTDKLASYSGSDRVAEIVQAAGDREVIVALDSDATEEAFKFARKWRSAFKRLRVAILSADLKDTKAADFERVLGA